MAEVVIQPAGDRHVIGTYNWLLIAAIGAALGALTWLAAWLLGNYVIDPLLCRNSALQACGQADVVAGNLAVIVSAIVGAIALIRLHVRHSLWTVLVVVLSFWGLSELTNPMASIEALGWTIGLYALSYMLFTWLMRLRMTVVAVVATAIVALVFRWIAFS